MKHVLPARLAAVVFAILTLGFKPTPAKTGTNFNENQFRASLWLQPLPHHVAPNATVYLSFINYASANVIINSVAVGDPGNYGSGDYPVQSGNIGYSIYDEASSSGPAYVSITINGPTPDPNAIRTLYLTDGLHTVCQEITGSGVYTFYDLYLSPYGTVTADVGGCN